MNSPGLGRDYTYVFLYMSLLNHVKGEQFDPLILLRKSM